MRATRATTGWSSVSSPRIGLKAASRSPHCALQPGGIALAQSLLMLQELPWQKPAPCATQPLCGRGPARLSRPRPVGRPDQVRNPLPSLLAPDYLENLAGYCPARCRRPAPACRRHQVGARGDHTTHFTVLDTEGNAATLSINLPFGAAFTAPGTGVLLNNEMDDFAADPSGRMPTAWPAARPTLSPGQAGAVVDESDLHRKRPSWHPSVHPAAAAFLAWCCWPCSTT